MVGYAINSYRRLVAPTKQFREPTDKTSCRIGKDLRDALSNMPARCERRRYPERGLRDRPPRAVLDPVKKGKDGRRSISLVAG